MIPENSRILKTYRFDERQRVRVVKETDSKSVGLCPRESKSRRCRFLYSEHNTYSTCRFLCSEI